MMQPEMRDRIEAHWLRRSLLLHSAVVFLLLLPIGLGFAGSDYLRGVALTSLLYFFIRSVANVKWSVTTYLLLFFLLPDTWAFDFGSFLPLITLRRMFLLILLLSFVLNYRRFISRERFPKAFRFAIGLLIFSYTMSTILSVDFRTSLFRLFHLIVEQIIFMFIIYKVLHGRELAKNGLMALCIAALFLCIFANVEYISKVNYFTQVSLSESSLRTYWATYENVQRLSIYGRIHSLCTHPMTFGGFLAIVFPIVIAFVLLSKNPLNRIGFFVIAFLCTEGVFFSLARSPVMALLAGIAVILIFMIREGRIKMSVSILFIGIVLLFGIFSLYEPARTLLLYSVKPWEQPVDMGGSSLASRIRQFKAATAYFSQRPVFGYGPGAGWIERTGAFSKELVGGLENFWIRNLLEIGWFGILSLVLFLGQVILLFYRSYKFSKGEPENILSISGIASLTAFLVFATATGEMGAFHLVFILLPLVIRSVWQSEFFVHQARIMRNRR